jgi:hypothetical protein
MKPFLSLLHILPSDASLLRNQVLPGRIVQPHGVTENRELAAGSKPPSKGFDNTGNWLSKTSQLVPGGTLGEARGPEQRQCGIAGSGHSRED